ncbi:unnamed protein product [Cuscuta epithymum]|uniref:Uncharacterized protein n=1 Tax=Cuscuta epithymum TaxID=186058 RepID=A0AAV0CC82_9ASTE|nr:unnamed protein product [Cuscuta epithymum]
MRPTARTTSYWWRVYYAHSGPVVWYTNCPVIADMDACVALIFFFFSISFPSLPSFSLVVRLVQFLSSFLFPSSVSSWLSVYLTNFTNCHPFLSFPFSPFFSSDFLFFFGI